MAVISHREKPSAKVQAGGKGGGSEGEERKRHKAWRRRNSGVGGRKRGVSRGALSLASLLGI